MDGATAVSPAETPPRDPCSCSGVDAGGVPRVSAAVSNASCSVIAAVLWSCAACIWANFDVRASAIAALIAAIRESERCSSGVSVGIASASLPVSPSSKGPPIASGSFAWSPDASAAPPSPGALLTEYFWDPRVVYGMVA